MDGYVCIRVSIPIQCVMEFLDLGFCIVKLTRVSKGSRKEQQNSCYFFMIGDGRGTWPLCCWNLADSLNKP